jgi:hypothetical protein
MMHDATLSALATALAAHRNGDNPVLALLAEAGDELENINIEEAEALAGALLEVLPYWISEDLAERFKRGVE